MSRRSLSTDTAPKPLLSPSRKVNGYECIWEDGTHILFASRECANDKARGCEVSPERIVAIRFTLPGAFYAECPQCGTYWGDCDESPEDQVS